MSTSRHIDKICIAAIVLSLVLTLLFMNGKVFGITPINDEESMEGIFTENDLTADWSTEGASQITFSGENGRVSGNGAYFSNGDLHIVYAGKYVLSGELSDGSVIVEADGDDKIWILLNGVSLNCENGAAVRIEQADKVFLTLADQTENSISGGENAAEEAIDGAVFSRDDLTINGSGALTVTSAYRHGIVCNDNLVITGGNIVIDAAGDGIHANDSIKIANADLTIHAGDDGIHASNEDETSYIDIESGHITIDSCYEGMEATAITVAGGDIRITPTDDGFNANGRGSNSVITITGGNITVLNPTGRDADGLDSNGSIFISGGKVFISVIGNGSNCAIDYGSENGGICEISGGTVVACGSSQMAEGFDEGSAQGFLLHSVNGAENTRITLTDSSGNLLLSEEIPYSFSSVLLSASGLKVGEPCTLTVGDTSEEITVDNSSGFGPGGMGGGLFDRGGKGGNRGGMFFPRQTAPEDSAQSRPSSFSAKEIQTPIDLAFTAPQMPSEGFGGNGGMPQMPPEGSGENGGMPQTPPEGFDENSEIPQMPEQGQDNGNMGGKGNWPNGQQMPQRGQEQNWQNNNALTNAGSAISSSDWILVGISVLFLSAGILFAFKIRH